MHSHRSGFRVSLVAILTVIVGVTGMRIEANAQDTPDVLPATVEHRALRDNVPIGFPPPTEPSGFQGFPDAPDFSVVSRTGKLTYYPCITCHSALVLNPQPRRLMSPHPAALDHGDGRLWCLDCHNADDRSVLKTLYGDVASFDEAYLVCGPCHYSRQKDWYFGGHGKRVDNWQGQRTIYNCTHCHNPHDPSVKPRAPEPPPPIRKGLQTMPTVRHEETPAAPYAALESEVQNEEATAAH